MMARLLGAGRIVATGRDDDALREIREIGADTVISTAVSDDELAAEFTAARAADGRPRPAPGGRALTNVARAAVTPRRGRPGRG
jgi:NADPH:quinone reductase-like Zn-dependent oxidoreductase